MHSKRVTPSRFRVSNTLGRQWAVEGRPSPESPSYYRPPLLPLLTDLPTAPGSVGAPIQNVGQNLRVERGRLPLLAQVWIHRHGKAAAAPLIWRRRRTRQEDRKTPTTLGRSWSRSAHFLPCVTQDGRVRSGKPVTWSFYGAGLTASAQVLLFPHWLAVLIGEKEEGPGAQSRAVRGGLFSSHMGR